MPLFFPSHDIALSNGVKHFNPPAAALRLQEDLAWLEEIFANPSPLTLYPSPFTLHPSPFTLHPLPWGWSWDTREYLHKDRHIPYEALPTDEQLEAIRQLSNRKTTIDILHALDFGGKIPEYITTEEHLDRFLREADEQGTDFVLKTPWSSSGRGLVRGTVTPRTILRQRAQATIRKMGGIIGEYWFPKSQDFAMLFFAGREEVSFLGYSLFDNEESGTYRQGYLLSNEEIERRLLSTADQLTHEELHAVKEQLLVILNDLLRPFFHLPWQIGYLGIDMMTLQHTQLTTHNTQHSPLHPCVELNLRCTMGVVARLWADRNLKEGESGRFIISPMGTDGHFEARFLID